MKTTHFLGFFIQYTSNIYIDNHNEQKTNSKESMFGLKKMNSILIRKNKNKKIRFANTLGKRHTKNNNQSDRKIYNF